MAFSCYETFKGFLGFGCKSRSAERYCFDVLESQGDIVGYKSNDFGNIIPEETNDGTVIFSFIVNINTGEYIISFGDGTEQWLNKESIEFVINNVYIEAEWEISEYKTTNITLNQYLLDNIGEKVCLTFIDSHLFWIDENNINWIDENNINWTEQ